MSEYWVSKKQYWCQYCKIFIRDDVPSRRLHETGLRHQGNKDRFLRDIYKSGEKAIREKAEEKKIMAQIEKQAALTHASAGNTSSSISAGPTSGSGSPSMSAIPKAKLVAGQPANKNDKYANYSTAESLGFVDADALLAERAKQEQEARAKIGQAGAWETVAVIMPSEPAEGEVEGEEDARYAFNGGEDSKYTTGLLRGSLDDDPGEEARSFKFETDRRTAAGEGSRGPHRVKPDVYDDGEWDPDSILKLGKRKGGADVKSEVKQETGEERNERVKSEEDEGLKGGLDRSAWKGKVISRDGEEVSNVSSEGVAEASGSGPTAVEAKKEEEVLTDSKPSGSSMFKKRKAPGAANRSVRQKM